MRYAMMAGALALALAAPAVAADDTGVPPKLAQFVAGLHKQSGDVAVPAAKATLHLGQSYYFVPADEAKRVVTEVWGNPPGAADGVLGIVMPAGSSVVDNTWAAVLNYDGSGYVTDNDANTADYNKVLSDLRDGETSDNEERKKSGYPAMHIVGWAQQPSYDKSTHALIWARDVAVDGAKADTLNYDVRMLGRHGVLSMNMLWTMPHLAEVRQAAETFGHTVSFDRGATYAEYNPSTDKAAGYGLAGLVAAGVGLAVAKKFGLIALILAFGKKALVLIAVVGAAIARFFRKFFRRGGNDGDGGAGDGGAEASA